MLTKSELARDLLAQLRLPKAMTVSQWADEKRMLSTKNGPEPGRWNTDRAPYQREIMDAISAPETEKIVVQSSSQVGKSEILLNALGYIICEDPGSVLFVQPTVEIAEKFSKERVDPMIQESPEVRKRVVEAKSRDKSNTILHKEFPGGFLALVGANSPRTLASRPCRYVLGDEIDGWPESSGDEGDPRKLAEARTRNFWNRKILYVCTPTIRGKSKIEQEYQLGSQEEWRKECPSCGEYHYMTFDYIKYTHEEKKVAGGAVQYCISDIAWACPSCGALHTEAQMQRANGKWIAKVPEQKRVRSFRLNALVSPWGDWESVIREYLEAGRDDERLKAFFNTTLGESYERQNYEGDIGELMQRREYYDAEVPEGVVFLTMAVDTQNDRLEYEVCGWGYEREKWGIEKGVLMGDPNEGGCWAGLDELLTREFFYADGTCNRIAATFIDTGGHRTQAAYAQIRRRRHLHVYAIKGDINGDGKPLSRASKKYGWYLRMLNVDVLKGYVQGDLEEKNVGPRYCHYPVDETRGYGETYFKGIYAEKLLPVRSQGQTKMRWTKISTERNEPLDLATYNMAIYMTFKWDMERMAAQRNMPGEQRKQEQTPKKRARRVVSKGVNVFE